MGRTPAAKPATSLHIVDLTLPLMSTKYIHSEVKKIYKETATEQRGHSGRRCKHRPPCEERNKLFGTIEQPWTKIIHPSYHRFARLTSDFLPSFEQTGRLTGPKLYSISGVC
jgi:hypothetical protein